MSKCKVFYKNWQMECCGTPFKPGDTVEWLVCDSYYLEPEIKLGKIDYYYEEHSSDWQMLSVLRGSVKGIKLLYTKYKRSDQFLVFDKLLDWKLVETRETHNFEKPLGDMAFEGYLVTLEDYTIRPAEEDEVSKEFIWTPNYILESGNNTEADYEEYEMEFSEYTKEE